MLVPTHIDEGYLEGTLREGQDERWVTLRNAFLKRVSPRQRHAVAGLLQRPLEGGKGLRVWMHRLLAEEARLPTTLPEELVQVYLDDSEAMPLHDCSGCGVAIPIEPGWLGTEGEPQRLFFPHCPCCGHATGLYAFWSRPLERDESAEAPIGGWSG